MAETPREGFAQPIEVDGQRGMVTYLDDAGNVLDGPDLATKARILWENGDYSWFSLSEEGPTPPPTP